MRFDAGRKAMVVDGDLVEQASTIFEKMRLTLAAGGLGLRDMVRIVQYVTPGAIPDLPRLKTFVTEACWRALRRREHRCRQEFASARSVDRNRGCRQRERTSGVEYLPTVSGTDCSKDMVQRRWSVGRPRSAAARYSTDD